MPNTNKKPKVTKKKAPAPKPKPKKHDITKIPGFKFGKGTI